MDTTNDIAIISMNCRYPGINSIDEFWNMLKNGIEIIEDTNSKQKNDSDNYIRVKTNLENTDLFDVDFFGFTEHEATITDPQHRLFLESAWEVFEKAGYDPLTYKGSIGLFTSVSISTYLLCNMVANEDYLNSLNNLQVMIGNDKDHLASHLAYKLNIKGPCATIQTACSSSLVGVHYGCESLLNGQSDMVLVGGVTLKYPSYPGYYYREGGLVSADGHLRAFDADASGTVYSNGLAMVVMKRLDDAIKDRDTIYAVIKGTAVNSDGSDRIGYTAPSVEGQIAVIEEGLAISGVEPDTIEYVEAHGSGTPLGDGIELKALKHVFERKTNKKEFCAIGSVKTNIGHVEMASGVSGLIKTALLLNQKKLVPSLNFEEPNSNMPIGETAFYVNTIFQDWKQSTSKPRRATVSSFGLGGINAFAVLEEYIPQATDPTESNEKEHVLAISAKTESALNRKYEDIIHYLNANPHVNVNDLLYTLNAGRSLFKHKKAIVFKSLDDLRQGNTLVSFEDANLYSSTQAIDLVVSNQLIFSENAFRRIYLSDNNFKRIVDYTLPLCKLQASEVDQILSGTSSSNDKLKQVLSFVQSYTTISLLKSLNVKISNYYASGLGELAVMASLGVLTLDTITQIILGTISIEECCKLNFKLTDTYFSISANQFVSETLLREISFWETVINFDSASSIQNIIFSENDDRLKLCLNTSLCNNQSFSLNHYSELEVENKLNLVYAYLWTQSCFVDWNEYFKNYAPHRIVLPTYPFDRKSFWLDFETPLKERDEQKLIKEFKSQRLDDEKLSFDQILNIINHIWKLNLGTEAVSLHESFFELGGNSLLATQVIFSIRKSMNVEISLQRFFEQPTIMALANLVNEALKSKDPDFEPLPVVIPDLVNRYEPFALTDIQKAYWLGRNTILDLGNTSTHMYFENDGKDLDIKLFNKSLQKMIERHEMLRAIILPDGRQQILREVPFYEIKVSDFRNKQADELDEEINKIRNGMSHHVLDCQTWPLFDIRASLLPDNIVRVHISIDLLITDAWSLELLMKDLSLQYHNPDYKFEKLELSFRDYAIAQEQIVKSSYYERSKAYWMSRIDSLPQGPQLNLAKDPSEISDPQFKRRKYILHKEKWQSIKNQSVKYGLTPTVVLVSAFSEILALWSKKAHFTLNLTLFNRLPLHEQINEIIGDFTSLTLLEIDFREAKAFLERTKNTQKQVLTDIDHRYFSGTMVTRELINRYKDASQAIIPVIFTSILNQMESTWGPSDDYLNDAGIEEEKDRYSISQTPQVWLDHQVIERNGHLCFNWDVVEELFPEGMIDTMFDCYCKLLEGLSSHSNLWLETSPIASIRFPNPYSKHLEHIYTLHRNTTEISDDLLHSGFLNQVFHNAEKPAIINSDATTISYNQLDRQSGSLSELLHKNGVKNEDIVAVVMDKSWHQIAASLAILRIGAAYLPIDSNYPSERIIQLVEQAKCRAVIIESLRTAEWHSSCDAPIIISDPDYQSQDYSLSEIKISPEDLAYVIYTSGSTGIPKGVMIDHRGAVNTIKDINTRFKVNQQDRVLAISSHNFDLSVYDIFGILSVGGSIVIPDSTRLRDPAHWAELISAHKVSIWNTVPALMKMLYDYLSPDLSQLQSIRLAMLSGDWIPVSLAESLLSASKMSVISLGGATEASIWSILFPIKGISPAWNSIPYGVSMVNQEICVLNDRLDYCPQGVTGELYISGKGLSLGYFGDPELSADRFFLHPVSGERLYRTGDMGRYMEDEMIEFLGRVDSQVKIGGYRIELGEIEAVLNQNQYVDNAVVTVNENASQKRLIAYIIPDKEQAFNLEGLNQDNIILNPIKRMEFKLNQKSIRNDLDQNTSIQLNHQINENEFIERRSYRSFENSIISFDHFSKFLSTISQHYIKDIPFPKYLYGSAGGLYPIQVYVYVGEDKIEDIPKALYYYNSKTRCLVKVDSDTAIERIIGEERNDPMFKTCAFSIFLVGDRDAIEPMYGKNESLNFMYLEAGIITQLLEMKAPAYDIGLCQVGKINKDCLMSYLKCKDNHIYFHCLVGGKINPEQKGLQGFYDDWNAYQKNGTDSEEKVHEEKRDFSELLKEYLENLLPHYMVPADFVVVDSIPLTANGKVDRKSLQNLKGVKREPEQVLINYIEPSSETENILRSIWQEIFGDKKFSNKDNFFDLGGDSISIVLVYKKVQDFFGKDISMVDLFKYPTLHDFARFLDKKQDRKEDISEVLSAENERAKSRKSMMNRLRSLNEELN